MRLTRPPTDAEAQAVILDVYRAHNFRLVDKRADPIFLSLASCLDMLRKGGMEVPDGHAFLADYATTIPDPCGTSVALIGWPGELASLGAADLPRACHEGHHGVEIATDGALTFCAGYLGSKEQRARYEGHAVAAADELLAALGIPWTDPGQHAEFFRAYALGDDQVDEIKGLLVSAHRTLAEGVSMYPIARDFTAALRAATGG